MKEKSLWLDLHQLNPKRWLVKYMHNFIPIGKHWKFLCGWVTFLRNFAINQFYVRTSWRNWLWHLLSFGLLPLLISLLRDLPWICPTSFLCFNFLFIVHLGPWHSSYPNLPSWVHQTTLPCSDLPIWAPSHVAKFPLEYSNYNSIKNVRLGIILLTQFRIGLKEIGFSVPKYYIFCYTQDEKKAQTQGLKLTILYHFTYRKKSSMSLRYCST